MRVALLVLSLATLASCLFTAKAGGAAEVDCSVCFANETLDVTTIPANDTGAEEAEEAKQECRSNQSTQIMVVGGLTGGFMVAAICRRTRRPRKAPTRWTQTPTQTQQPRRKLSTHWLPAHTYLPPRGRKQHSVATNEQGMQTLPPPRSYEEGSQTFAVRQRTLTLTLTLTHPQRNPYPSPSPNPKPNPGQVATRDAMAQAETRMGTALTETRSCQADLDRDLDAGVPGGLDSPSPKPKPEPETEPNPPQPQPGHKPDPDPDQEARPSAGLTSRHQGRSRWTAPRAPSARRRSRSPARPSSW